MRPRCVLWAALLLGLGLGTASARESRAFGGERGMSRTFTLVGGNYSIYVYAKNPSHSTFSGVQRTCVFGGDLQRVDAPGRAMAFGNGVTVGSVIGYKLGPTTISLPRGTYKVLVAAMTNCLWHVILESGDENGAGVAGVELGDDPDDTSPVQETIHLHKPAQFLVQYRTDHLKEVPVSARLEVIHGGRVAETYPMKLGSETESQASVAYQAVNWTAADARLVGKNTARVVMTIDGKEFLSTADFNLAP